MGSIRLIWLLLPRYGILWVFRNVRDLVLSSFGGMAGAVSDKGADGNCMGRDFLIYWELYLFSNYSVRSVCLLC